MCRWNNSGIPNPMGNLRPLSIWALLMYTVTFSYDLWLSGAGCLTEGTQAQWKGHRPQKSQGHEEQGAREEDLRRRSLSRHSRGESQRILRCLRRGTTLFTLHVGTCSLIHQTHHLINLNIHWWCDQVESIELPMENKTNKRRGFCFITFKEEDPVKSIMEKKYHNIGLSKVQTALVPVMTL